MYQQQMYMQMQEEQMRRMAYEQEILRREVERQKKEKMELEKWQPKHGHRELRSRDRERDALALLGAFEKINTKGRNNDYRGLDDFFEEKSHEKMQPKRPPSIKEEIETPKRRGGSHSERRGGSLGERKPHMQSTPNFTPNKFQQNASMMLNSPIYYPPFGANPYQNPINMGNNPGGPLADYNFILKLLELTKNDSKPKSNRISEMLKSSLDKQNQILESMASNLANEKEEHYSAENRELERQIKVLELESETKKRNLFDSGPGQWETRTNNFNRIYKQ